MKVVKREESSADYYLVQKVTAPSARKPVEPIVLVSTRKIIPHAAYADFTDSVISMTVVTAYFNAASVVVVSLSRFGFPDSPRQDISATSPSIELPKAHSPYEISSGANNA